MSDDPTNDDPKKPLEFPAPVHTEAPDEAQASAERQRLAFMIRQIDFAVESTFVTAVSYQRLIGLDPHEVPRLCVQAGCRFVEKLVEGYQRRRNLELQGAPVRMSLEERERRQVEIKAAAADLVRVLEEGLHAARGILGQMQHDEGPTTDPNAKPN